MARPKASRTQLVYRVYPDPTNDLGTVDALSELPNIIPGVWVKAGPSGSGWLAGAGITAYALLMKELDRRGVKYRLLSGKVPEPPVVPLVELPKPKEWGKGIKFYPWQVDALERARSILGLIITHPCGAGKTPTAIRWGIDSPGLCIVLVRPGARIQWAREIAKFTTNTQVLVVDEQCLRPALGGQQVVLSNALFLAETTEETRTTKPVMAMPTTAAALAKRFVSVEPKPLRVLVTLTSGGCIWATVTSAARARVAGGNAYPPNDPELPAKTQPGYVFTFAELTAIEPLPKFLVVGWSRLVQYNEFLRSLKPVSLVMDESQIAKGHRRYDPIFNPEGGVTFAKKNNLVANAKNLAEISYRRLATSATPLQNRPEDLWGQLDLILPGEFGGFQAFAKRYCNQHVNQWGGLDNSGSSNEAELAERLEMVRHYVSKEETHKHLPPKRRIVHYLPESEQVDPGDFHAEVHEASKRGSGALNHVDLMMAAAKKRTYIVGRVLEVVREGGKVVVFTGRRRDCEVLGASIREALVKAKINSPVFIGHGGFSAADRQQMIDGFMAAKTATLVGTGESFGESLNLQDADLQIHAMLPVTPGQVIQREGRVHRIGMTRPVIVEYVIAEGTYDERVATILLNKLPAVETITKNKEIAGMSQDLAYGEAGETLDAATVEMLGNLKGVEFDDDDER